MVPADNSSAYSVSGQLVGSPGDAPLLLRPEDSCAFVIFGASGDLTGRKLIPALYNLACQKLLPPGFAVIGFAVTPMDDASFRESMRDWVSKSHDVISYNHATWDNFAQLLHYITADFEKPEGFHELSKRLSKIDTQLGCAGNRLWYLATAPPFFGTIVKNLGKHDLAEAKQGSWSRVVIEKPFG